MNARKSTYEIAIAQYEMMSIRFMPSEDIDRLAEKYAGLWVSILEDYVMMKVNSEKLPEGDAGKFSVQIMLIGAIVLEIKTVQRDRKNLTDSTN